MSDIGNMRISIGLDAVDFTRGIQDINRRITALNSEFRSVTAGAGRFDNSLESLRNQQNILTRSMDAHKLKVKELQRMYQESVQTSGENSDATIRLATQYNNAVAAMRRTEDQLERLNGRINQQTDRWQVLQRSVSQAGERLQNAGRQMASIGKTMTMSVTAPIVGAGVAAVKTAIDFESAFAGVRKTVNATEEEFANLEKGIRDMAKAGPSSAEELAGIAESAGQLGIAKENILSFTSTMSDLGTATNMTSEEAATSLARLANITQMPQTQFDRLGSTIVNLGNNLATTEAEITEFGLRIAGAGAQVGLSEAEILSIGAALSSVGINAEAGGTAISKVMIEIANATATGGEMLDRFAKVAGVSSSDFKKAFETDASGAIVTFIEGLGKMSDSGENVFAILEDLGLQEVRVRDAMLRASGAGDLLRKSLDLGTSAWEENNALTKEASERYKTTESQLKATVNKLKDLGVTTGRIVIPPLMKLVDKVEAGIKKFEDMDESTQKTVLSIGGIAAVAGPALTAIGFMTTGVGGLLKVVAPLIPALGAGGGLAAVIGGITGPIGLAVAAIGGLAAVTISATKDVDKAKEVNLEHAESLIAQKQELDGLATEYEKLGEKNKLSNDELMRFRDIQSELELAKSTEELKRLKDEQSKLVKQSGLTNEEILKFIELNDRIIETAPNVDRVYSERGNAIIANKEALKDVNQELQTSIELELENQRIRAEAKLDENIRNHIQALEELQKMEAKRDAAVQEREQREQEILDLRLQKQKQMSDGQEALAQQTAIDIQNKQMELSLQNDKVAELADEVAEKQKSVDKTNEELIKTQELHAKMIDVQLMQTGINQVGAEGIKQLDDAITKSQGRIQTLLLIKENQGGLNKQQQEELDLLSQQLSNYQSARSEIRNIQSEQESVNQRIDEGIEKASGMNKELGKDVKKNLNVDDQGKAKEIHKEASKDATKTLTIGAVVSATFQNAVKAFERMSNINIPGFAAGTQDAPGGLVVIGE